MFDKCIYCGGKKEVIGREKIFNKNILGVQCKMCGHVDFFEENFQAKEEKFIICNVCGNEIPDDLGFCPYCETIIKR